MEKTTKLTLTEKPSAPSFIHRGNSVGKKNEEDTKKTVKRKRKKAAFRKAPEAPRRFKSPYILFSISKMAEYKSSTPNVQVTAISRRIAEEWKTLSDSEKRKWDQVALQDKLRYNAEKRLYTGPWQVPSKRSRKDPSAPKRPPSAFLFYSQTQRKKLKQENPNMKNTEISKLLGQQWKEAPQEVRQPHIDREHRERELYKGVIAEWRKQRRKEEACVRQQRIAVAEQYIRSGACPPPGYPSSLAPWGRLQPQPMGGTIALPPNSQQSMSQVSTSNHSIPSMASQAPEVPSLGTSGPQQQALSETTPGQSIMNAEQNKMNSTDSCLTNSDQTLPEVATSQPGLAELSVLVTPQQEEATTPTTPTTKSEIEIEGQAPILADLPLEKPVPPIPFAYSNGEIVETSAMSAQDPRLFPSFFFGDTSFDPVLPLLAPNSP